MPDEVGTLGALLMGPAGAFITGSSFLMDGGVTSSCWFGEFAPKQSVCPRGRALAKRALKSDMLTCR
jgi:hypothetical protein